MRVGKTREDAGVHSKAHPFSHPLQAFVGMKTAPLSSKTAEHPNTIIHSYVNNICICALCERNNSKTTFRHMLPQGCCIGHAAIECLKVTLHVQKTLAKSSHFLLTGASSQSAKSAQEAYPDLVELPQADLGPDCLTPKM